MAGTSRNLLNLFHDSQAGGEEDEFFGDGSQVATYSPPIGFIPPPAGGVRPGTGGFFAPVAPGVVPPAAARVLPPRQAGFVTAPAPPFMDLAAPAVDGLDLNAQAAAFPGLEEYQLPCGKVESLMSL